MFLILITPKIIVYNYLIYLVQISTFKLLNNAFVKTHNNNDVAF